MAAPRSAILRLSRKMNVNHEEGEEEEQDILLLSPSNSACPKITMQTDENDSSSIFLGKSKSSVSCSDQVEGGGLEEGGANGGGTPTEFGSNNNRVRLHARSLSQGDRRSSSSSSLVLRGRGGALLSDGVGGGRMSPQYGRRAVSTAATHNHCDNDDSRRLHNHQLLRRGLAPPTIIYQTATAPSSPTESMSMQDSWRMMGGGSSFHLNHHKAVLLTPTGSLLAVNQSPMELRESTLSINYPELDDGEEVFLVYARHEKIPMKDFGAEIRASMDVENFLHQAQLMLDIQENNMEAIIDSMLHHLLDKEEPHTSVSDAKKAIFTHESVRQLSKTIQGTCSTYGGGFDYDQSWVCLLCTLSTIQKRHVAIARLRTPANLGRTNQEVYFIILVLAPTKEKGTKNALETGRTFATLFADMDLRLRLLAVRSEVEFKKLLWEHTKELAEEQAQPDRKMSSGSVIGANMHMPPEDKGEWFIAKGLRSDFKRRIKCYWSDYRDGVIGRRAIPKTASTTIFLYFACILPSIALGVLNDDSTGGHLNVRKVIYSQALGGVFFSLFGGQPMVVLLTSAPIALYVKAIKSVCDNWDLDFVGMYACTGLWSSFFLIIYSVSDASRLMKWTTRSTDEIFTLFISIAFIVEAVKNVYSDFAKYYHSKSCFVQNATIETLSTLQNVGINVENTTSSTDNGLGPCMREHSLLYLLLTVGTVWLGLSLYNFTKTPFLNASKRELLADYALPVSVLLMSVFGSYVFKDVNLEPFDSQNRSVFTCPPLLLLHWTSVLSSMGMGFCLSLLFYLEQNIAAAMVNSPENKLKKGPAYHWDLLVVALLNAILTFFGLPMVHGALPHSPLHVRAMADVEDRVDQGHVYQKIMHVRETRLTAFFSHILIGLSLLMLPYPLSYIPRPVLDGLFLYLAAHAVQYNQMFERIMLLVTEQSAYPPNHYIRSVPQRKVHLFTFLQLIQLVSMCACGFSPLPYLKMIFPVLIFLLLPFRHKLVPRLIEKKYLDVLDGH